MDNWVFTSKAIKVELWTQLTITKKITYNCMNIWCGVYTLLYHLKIWVTRSYYYFGDCFIFPFAFEASLPMGRSVDTPTSVHLWKYIWWWCVFTWFDIFCSFWTPISGNVNIEGLSSWLHYLSSDGDYFPRTVLIRWSVLDPWSALWANQPDLTGLTILPDLMCYWAPYLGRECCPRPHAYFRSRLCEGRFRVLESICNTCTVSLPPRNPHVHGPHVPIMPKRWNLSLSPSYKYRINYGDRDFWLFPLYN